jgi:hypothetical protein
MRYGAINRRVWVGEVDFNKKVNKEQKIIETAKKKFFLKMAAV